MVILNQLNISKDAKTLYINFEVPEGAYFDNVYLDSISIITADKVSQESPNTPSTQFIYKKTYDTQEDKDSALVIDVPALNAAFLNTQDGEPIDSTKPYATVAFDNTDFSKKLFFVYIKTTPVPLNTPCELSDDYTVGVVFDTTVYYQKVMDYSKELIKCCSIPTAFTDFVLRWEAYKAAVETKHYLKAIEFYNLLFKEATSGTLSNGTTKSCGCHG